jgi:D-glycero-alpha-D-manno-heptose 1-phosphate guanylyltransferase
MITEAIVLAGGTGTRLKSVVADVPKSLAPIAGIPFLAYLLDYAGQQGIEKFIFALGYKTEQIEAFVKDYLPAGSYIFSVEDDPLGTGGAIYKSCQHASSKNVMVLNADTLFLVPVEQFSWDHEVSNAFCSLALKEMKTFDRYGIVDTSMDNIVTGFHEKKYCKAGLINGGVYALQVEPFLRKKFPEIFSFEKDYLENEYVSKKVFGFVYNSYFIDIGIPEDYQRAQTELIQYRPHGI